jgi:FixJ family two-component response regulator
MKPAKIYVVDDQISVCHSLEFLFTSHYDVSVETYQNPLLFLNNVPSKCTGCIIIDLFMPFMNGIDVIKELKTRKNQLDIILTSGHADANIATQSLIDKSVSFLRKPFNITHLLAVVGKSLDLAVTD